MCIKILYSSKSVIVAAVVRLPHVNNAKRLPIISDKWTEPPSKRNYAALQHIESREIKRSDYIIRFHFIILLIFKWSKINLFFSAVSLT